MSCHGLEQQPPRLNLHIFTKLSWGSEPDQFLKGHSINRFLMKEYHELVIWSGRLNTGDVKNQIVVFSNCTNEEKAKTAAKYFQENGAAGIAVIANINTWFYNLDCLLPAVSLSEKQGNKFKILVNEAKNEKKELYARIHETEEVPAEKIYVADFSSRGHNPSFAHIAKPDFTAPGRLLCCAKLQEKTDDGRQCYKLGFGTSYAAPIAGGGMLALKANHSTWTESMIKSAFITTARNLELRDPDDASEIQAGGGGLIDFEKADKAGFLYNIPREECCKYILSNPAAVK